MKTHCVEDIMQKRYLLELRDCLADGMQMIFFQEQTSFKIAYVKGDSKNCVLFSQKYRM